MILGGLNFRTLLDFQVPSGSCLDSTRLFFLNSCEPPGSRHEETGVCVGDFLPKNLTATTQVFRREAICPISLRLRQELDQQSNVPVQVRAPLPEAFAGDTKDARLQ